MMAMFWCSFFAFFKNVAAIFALSIWSGLVQGQPLKFWLATTNS